MNIEIDINKEWFEKNQKHFLQEYNDDKYIDADQKNTTYRIVVTGIKNNAMLVNEDDKMEISAGSDEVYLHVEEKPTIDELLNLAKIITKYYNKAKSAIEALK